jgi:hypothetical protein
MSVFGQMEADWRDQQSGAREQQYDEEPEDQVVPQIEDQPKKGNTVPVHKLPCGSATLKKAS